MTKLTKNRRWVGLLLGLVAVVALVFAMSFQQLHANPADSVDQATDQAKVVEMEDTEADLQANSTSDAEISDADSSINNTNGDEATLTTANLNNDESSTNDSYIVKFAMPKEYINSNKLSYIQLIQNTTNKATSMTDTETDITIDGTVYRIYKADTTIEPTKEKTNFKVSLDISTNDTITTQWYSDVEWQYGENIVAVPQDYTRMKLSDYNGFVEFVNISSHTVTYDVQGHGSAPQKQTVKTGDLVPKPTDPSEIGYTFGGWYKEKGCTNIWTFESDPMPDSDLTLYAKWSPAPATVNVKFDPNYEGAESSTIEEVVGNNYTLPNPAPSRTNYDFTGWFTEMQGGTQVTSATKVEITTDHTLYAHWTEIPAPTYNITIVQPERGGSVAADKTTASKGETVTLTVTPDAKFSVKDVSIKDAAGTSLEYQTITENIQYSFIMPESDATAKITLIADKPEEGYVVTEGANGTYVSGSGTPYTIRVNSDISRFANVVTLNGTPIDPSNYDVRSGSTIVTLHSDYLNTLPAGTHQIGIKFVDETVNANLTIAGNSDAQNTTASSTSSTSSSTGDSIPFAGLVTFVVASAGAVAFASRKRLQA